MLEPVDIMDVADSDFLNEDQFFEDDSNSGSDSEIEKYYVVSSTRNRLFGRNRPLHVVLGSGKLADVILWRIKNISASILVGATIIWFLFESLGYHLLTFVCHATFLSLTTLFFWSTLATYTDIPPPELPIFVLPKRLLVSIALSMRNDCNQALRTFRDIASGKDLKEFLKVTMILWLISFVGSCFNIVTLSYMVPVLYERHEDTVDTFAEKALLELMKQCRELNKMVRRKLPISISSKDN
ncbi:Reticulon-like protein [Quillaja saponaria]|uniref:Reticulon-like protein n=1 Tax=Quillaja saponaria TaxID=32244 RepID=A0AAD7LKS4_QUISA|nr:Reticulon-like protein [Quillaja saponaria]